MDPAQLSSELGCLTGEHINFFLENRLAGRVAKLDIMSPWAQWERLQLAHCPGVATIHIHARVLHLGIDFYIARIRTWHFAVRGEVCWAIPAVIRRPVEPGAKVTADEDSGACRRNRHKNRQRQKNHRGIFPIASHLSSPFHSSSYFQYFR